MTEKLTRYLRLSWYAVKWTYLDYRYHHYSLTCRVDGLECDPRSHLHVTDAIRIARVLA